MSDANGGPDDTEINNEEWRKRLLKLPKGKNKTRQEEKVFIAFSNGMVWMVSASLHPIQIGISMNQFELASK